MNENYTHIKNCLISYKHMSGFVVPFEEACTWLGYASKSSAKRKLLKNFVEDIDYIVQEHCSPEKQWGGHNREIIILTKICFREFVLIAQTSTSHALRKFILEIWGNSDELTNGDISIEESTRKKHRITETFVSEFEQEIAIRNDTETRHNIIRDKLAKETNGTIETINEYGRCDVETKDTIIEVKPISKFTHGIGQVLCYSKASEKKALLYVFGGKPSPNQFNICKELKIELRYEF
jgi:hypothetical protein